MYLINLMRRKISKWVAESFSGSMIERLSNDAMSLEWKIIKEFKRFGTVDLRGKKFWIDYEDSAVSKHIWRCAIWEKETTLFLEKNIRRGQKVVDIGAHIGYYTVLFSDLVGNEGHVYAFEPDPINFKLLRRNAEPSNTTIENKAVSNVDGYTELFLNSEGNKGDHRIFPMVGRKSIKIKTIKIDTYFADNRIDFIKCDTQGAEPLVLKGAEQTLKRCKPVVIIECCPLWKQAKQGIEKSFDPLLDAGYSLYEIKRTGKLTLKKPNELFKMINENKSELNEENLLCLPDYQIKK